ncbi:TcpQ domain-containing protein [Endozoicomonas sp. SESOKO1]|uniref:TcpQ domain-containing protein n=1 Tax=Endozoicomonas sp. SESOKO1 TaxID=2828742 RepID=UPI0027D29E6E|nr:TcpQ domain-containing protein [Endozoicomonas sp. SESOKO1]
MFNKRDIGIGLLLAAICTANSAVASTDSVAAASVIESSVNNGMEPVEMTTGPVDEAGSADVWVEPEKQYPVLHLNTYDKTEDMFVRWATEHDYVVKWNTDKTVEFANATAYQGSFRAVLTDLASDIAALGIDLNFKVFEKNKVIVVYSVR